MLVAGVRALVNMKGHEDPAISATAAPLDAKLTVFFRSNRTKMGTILEFEGQSFAVEV